MKRVPTTDVRKSVDAADLNMKNKSLDNCRRVRVSVNYGKDRRSIKALTINVYAKKGLTLTPTDALFSYFPFRLVFVSCLSSLDNTKCQRIVSTDVVCISLPPHVLFFSFYFVLHRCWRSERDRDRPLKRERVCVCVCVSEGGGESLQKKRQAFL
jgi:hypothetical protein